MTVTTPALERARELTRQLTDALREHVETRSPTTLETEPPGLDVPLADLDQLTTLQDLFDCAGTGPVAQAAITARIRAVGGDATRGPEHLTHEQAADLIDLLRAW